MITSSGLMLYAIRKGATSTSSASMPSERECLSFASAPRPGECPLGPDELPGTPAALRGEAPCIDGIVR